MLSQKILELFENWYNGTYILATFITKIAYYNVSLKK